ncbi:MAG TPA: TfoX/Sxy family protein [Phenylobacterium sp.]|nr:TfoX/Sxy family protein [Phenylobacterium sp.]
MTHNPKALQAVFQTAAPPDMELAFKAMFGGIMGYVDGKAFASLSDVGLALKLAGEDYAELLGVPGARALQYTPDTPPSKSYVVVPDAWLADREALRAWIVRGAARLKPAKPRKARALG